VKTEKYTKALRRNEGLKNENERSSNQTDAPARQNMYMFFGKDVHVFEKRCTCFGENIYIF